MEIKDAQALVSEGKKTTKIRVSYLGFFLSSASSNKIRLAAPSRSSYCLFFKLHKKVARPIRAVARAIGIRKIKTDIFLNSCVAS